MIVYDIEIQNPPVANPKKKGDYKIANGWEDYKGMGIACAVFYDMQRDLIRIYKDNLPTKELHEIVNSADILVGYNNRRFDDNLLRSMDCNVPLHKSYDILHQFYMAKGLSEEWNPRTHGGYSLDKMCMKNLNMEKAKSGSGADAPYLWQDGKRQEVIDYCINDVMITAKLLSKIFELGGLHDCKTKAGKFYKMPLPYISFGGLDGLKRAVL